jgi:two-component system response regulator RegA
MSTLLLVDDDEFLRERLARALTARGLEVRTAANADEAISTLAEWKPKLAVLDLKMPGRTGLELLREVKQLSPAIQVVLLTGYGSIANAVEALRGGAVGYITKPADADQILEAFRKGAPEQAASDSAIISAPSLAEAEWNHIQQVLADCDGNVTRAAEQLQIPRRSLQRKLKKRP